MEVLAKDAAAFSQAAEMHSIDVQAAYAMLAYKLRVMCSHVREKFDVAKADPPERLIKSFNIMANIKQSK
eukprot:3845218-Lingulodinium_polyedra.AAC.1